MRGCGSKGVAEARDVPKVSDHPQVVAWLVVKVTFTLLVPGGIRLLAGARLVMENAPLAAAAAGTQKSTTPMWIAFMNQ
jgi:hypothetical protein